MSIVKDLIYILPILLLIAEICRLKHYLLLTNKKFLNFLKHDINISLLAQKRGIDLVDDNSNKELLPEVREACGSTLKMVNTLIDAYKIEVGEISLHPEIFKLSDLVKEVFLNLSNSADLKNINFYHNVNDDTLIYTDRYYLFFALNFLITKAINESSKNGKIFLSFEQTNSKMQYNISFITENKIKKNHLFSHFSNYSLSPVGHGIEQYLYENIISAFDGNIKNSVNDHGIASLTFTVPNQFCMLKGKV